MSEEPLITLAQAAHRLPRPVHAATLGRWARRGVRGVRLDVVRLGGRVYTSPERLGAFLAALARKDAEPPHGPAGD